MKKGGLLLGMVIVLVICLSLYAVTLFVNRQSENQEESAPVLTVVKSVSPEAIVGFTLTGTKASHEFQRQEGGWVYNHDPHFPLNTDFTNTTLEALSSISAIEVIEEAQADLAVYGLEQPQMTLTLVEEGEKTTRFFIGNYNSFNGYYYMRMEGTQDIFVIDNKLVDLCSKEEKDIIKLDTLPETFSSDKITAIKVTYQGAAHTFTAEDEFFEGLVKAAGSLSLKEYEKYNLEQQEEAKYGLDDPIQIQISYSDTVNSSAEGSSSVTSAVHYEYRLTVGSSFGDSVFFLAEDSRILYKMDKKLFMDLEPLLDKWETLTQ